MTRTLPRAERRRLLWFLLPAAALLLLSQGWPLLYSLYLSFVDWQLTKSLTPKGFVGLANYGHVLTDDQFLHAAKLSLLFMLVSAGVQLLLGFAMAYLTVGEHPFLQISRTILLIPMVVAPVAVGTMWRMLLNAQTGLVNYLLHFVGIKGPDWLGNPDLALWSTIGVDIWQWLPFSMIVYVAFLSGLSGDVVEAAHVDGASRWQVLRYIYIPLAWPATLLILLFRLIDSFFVLDAIYSTTYGGPGFATSVMSFELYRQALKYFNIGWSAAATWILLTLSIALAVILLRLRNRIEV